MIIRQAIVDALYCVSAVLALLAVATVVRKSFRDAADRRRERTEAEVRPRLLKLLATEGEQEGDLATVGGREGRVLDSVTASLLTKLRGEDRAAVVQMLEARGRVQAAQRALRGRGTVKRARAAELLGATAVPAAYDDLIALLHDRSPELRGVTARALGGMGLADAVAPLLDSLDAERPVAAGLVTMALLHIGPPAEEPLRELGLVHKSPQARRIAAELLGVYGVYAAVGALSQCTRDDEDPAVRTAAVAALGRIGHPHAVDTLVACFGGETPAPLHTAAARSLGQVGSPKALEALVAAVGHEDHTVARNAAEALTRLAGPGRAALYDIAREGDTASLYARGALSAAERARRAIWEGRMNVLKEALHSFDVFVIFYFVALNSGYLFLITLAGFDVGKTVRRVDFAGYDSIFANPLTPGVTVLVPAFNEEPTIVETVRGLLGLRFPEFEVIVIDDGSTDNTFGRLHDEFDLVPIERVIPDDVPTIAPVNSVHTPRGGQQLLVIRKDNVGRRSDPMNVGINAASYPLVCMIDADSLLDESALLRVVKPFVDDPVHTIGSGGVIRAANGSEVASGRILDPRMPKGWVARIQVVEYLRSFLLGRTAWGRMSGLLIISGAFAMFRRDVLVEVGGLDLHCLGEDAELVARLHHAMRKVRRGYRFVFVAEPVCWTEVPDTLKVLGRQRRRWSRGLAEVLWKHRSMMGNPKYGFIGMVVLPYYLVFELLGAVVELTGIFAVILGLFLGVVDVHFAVIFAVAALGYGILLSFAALTVEEFSFHRYAAWKDLGAGLGAALLENVGFRQLHAWWRVRGLFNAITSTSKEWEDMPRTGFDEADVAGNAAALVAAGAVGSAAR